ncbi:Regulator of competence-specific genes [Moraxella lacunata]|uniref:Regulator of competence-specific genes n=1 Tax=Moraxella lacunata TaxID=477 RepID=A0A378TTH6_MORLA|nr:TfoX/Sxy family protein [Moraxella lacunata]STZ63614.1 Regulator of competence-specific genes [Moraxella lacunata]
MTAYSEFTAFILDQLAPLAPITVKQMFGAKCLFKNGKMFGIISNDTLYLKADDDNRQAFIDKNCEKFTYWTSRAGVKKQVALGYYQLPEFALDDTDELCRWAGLGIGASQKNQMPRPNHQK